MKHTRILTATILSTLLGTISFAQSDSQQEKLDLSDNRASVSIQDLRERDNKPESQQGLGSLRNSETHTSQTVKPSSNSKEKSKDLKSLGGYGAGNGGGYVKRNGQIEIMDPFVQDPNGSKEMTLSKVMQEYLQETASLISENRYVNTGGLLFWNTYEPSSKFREFIFNNVLANTTEYLYVKQLPCSDASDMVDENGDFPNDYGCTIHGTTYILRNKFEAMSFRDQALGILHERLHAYAPNAPHRWITGWIKAVRKQLEILEAQRNGDRSLISADDIAVMNSLMTFSQRLGFEVRSLSVVRTPMGGGWVRPKATVSANSFIGVTANALAEKIDHSIVLESMVWTTVLQNSQIARSEIDSKGQPILSSQITQSNLTVNGIIDSKLNKSSLQSQTGMNGVESDNCEFSYINVGHAVRCHSSKLETSQLSSQLEDGVELLNSHLEVHSYAGQYRHESGSKLTIAAGTKVQSAHVDFKGSIGDIRLAPRSGAFQLDGRHYTFGESQKPGALSEFFNSNIPDTTITSVEDFLKHATVVNQ
jgi:hypothetical protein